MQFCDEERPKLYISKPNHHSVNAEPSVQNTAVFLHLKDKEHTLKDSQRRVLNREHRASQREVKEGHRCDVELSLTVSTNMIISPFQHL